MLPLQGSWTLDSFSEALEIPEPHRRWAYESAALDLGLRQDGTALAEVLGLEPRPVSFVVSPGLGDPPSARVVRRWLELDPGLRFKLDPGDRLERRPHPRAGGHEGNRHRRSEGLLRRSGREAAGRRPLPARRRGPSGRFPRGPGPHRRDRSGARAVSRSDHVGRPDPFRGRRRDARVSAADAQLEAVSVRHAPRGCSTSTTTARSVVSACTAAACSSSGRAAGRSSTSLRFSTRMRRTTSRRAPSTSPSLASGLPAQPARAGPLAHGVPLGRGRLAFD